MRPYSETIPGTNVKFEMMPVPGGEFVMGSPATEPGRAPDEGPPHAVQIRPFWIGKFEITNGEWRKFRDDAGYDDPKFWPGKRPVPKDQVPYWKDDKNHGGGTPGSRETNSAISEA